MEPTEHEADAQEVQEVRAAPEHAAQERCAGRCAGTETAGQAPWEQEQT